jgi:hypothetical protein
MEVGGQVHILITLPPWKETLVSVEWKAGGPHTWSGCNSEDKNLFPQLGTQPQHSVEPAT